MFDEFYFLQQLINGLTVGSAYALIAIGYTMVYGIIGMINFAHGEIYMIGAYTSLIVITGLAALNPVWLPLVLLVALICAMIVSSSMGWAVERVAYRPVRGQHRLIPLISAIGMSIFLQNYVHLAQGSRNIGFPSLIDGGFTFGTSEGFQTTISNMQLTIFATTLVCMTLLSLFISRSKTGRACRAVSQDRKMSSLLGIDTNRIIAATFVIGAALAAVAGLLLGMYYGSIDPLFGFIAGLKAFTAAVLGGIGSIPGAMLGGLILGVAESFTAGYLSSEYKDVVSFSLLILILLFRPTGLLGKPEVEKI
ncbi:L-leucine ABC transporter membrane protein /L-isoleucine ABC transporter membrane protein /L-valine ABC transporter membrane protein [Tamilnaduibacter salinus]|uniref:Branched-chain amino acid ABC transporter permease LivH n=1 Tax=Tamilnaduibacter salinus TaxID=1484056 RepID=A0A2A2I497_9GAMM|nr:high-affinity branched-chain amino acid ABC transporter permease LivH [Tamilnaduibacter salinus]PAV26831.1 branched-chain amino acid ABC transporter permease LivH [Tamilnaduibacter salinus]PVY75929.1 L-leucine ABC transporter membrane protein /L-isoleucine ABC transporter membrane protein /L-valine ABC transporter membrane protein [Tamilnaduibacter salinus]